MHTNFIQSNNKTAVPTSPTNLVYTVSDPNTVTLSWNHPTYSTRVDYYEYSFQLSSSYEIVATHNTTNNSVILVGVPYNDNFTFTVTANNCVGQGIPTSITDVIGKAFVNA